MIARCLHNIHFALRSSRHCGRSALTASLAGVHHCSIPQRPNLPSPPSARQHSLWQPSLSLSRRTPKPTHTKQNKNTKQKHKTKTQNKHKTNTKRISSRSTHDSAALCVVAPVGAAARSSLAAICRPAEALLKAGACTCTSAWHPSRPAHADSKRSAQMAAHAGAGFVQHRLRVVHTTNGMAHSPRVVRITHTQHTSEECVALLACV